jgi:acetolactate synthase regulatory subunit
MSTDLQKYSTENQLHTIRRYAEQRGFTIVRVTAQPLVASDDRQNIKLSFVSTQRPFLICWTCVTVLAR